MKITARSSHGTIVFGSETGLVLTGESNLCGCEECPQVERFDVEEYRKFYGVEELPGSMDIDILDLGYWGTDGIYEEPCHGWREEVAILRVGGEIDRSGTNVKIPDPVRISAPKEDYTNAVVHIPNVNLHLLEKQRRAFLEYTAGIDSFQEEREGLENFLNVICDAFYDQTYGRSALLPELNDADDVKHWFEFLIEELDISIHPDNPFEDYINNEEPGEPTFEPDTASQLNQKMEQAFRICSCSGRDIYEIGMDITRRALAIPTED